MIMPDHVHLFVRGNLDFSLKQWVRMLKRDSIQRNSRHATTLAVQAFSIM